MVSLIHCNCRIDHAPERHRRQLSKGLMVNAAEKLAELDVPNIDHRTDPQYV